MQLTLMQITRMKLHTHASDTHAIVHMQNTTLTQRDLIE